MILHRFKKVFPQIKSALGAAAFFLGLAQTALPAFAQTTPSPAVLQNGAFAPPAVPSVEKKPETGTVPASDAVRLPPAVLDFLAAGALSAPAPGPQTQDPAPSRTSGFVPPPEVAPPPETVSTRTVTLGGTKAPGQSIWISVNGGRSYAIFAAEDAGTVWSASVNLTDGANDFKIVAVDGSLNPSDEVAVPTITYRHTVTPPRVAPPPLSVSDRPWILLSGTKAAGESIRASVNGGQSLQLIPKTSDTKWSAPVKLTKGLNYFTLFARDKAGHSSEAVLLPPVSYSMTPPAVTPPPSVVDAHTVILSGSKTAGASLWISSDGVSYKPLVRGDSATHWSAGVPLSRGDNHFTIVAEDPAGNASDPIRLPVIRGTAVTPAPEDVLFLQVPALVPAGI